MLILTVILVLMDRTVRHLNNFGPSCLDYFGLRCNSRFNLPAWRLSSDTLKPSSGWSNFLIFTFTHHEPSVRRLSAVEDLRTRNVRLTCASATAHGDVRLMWSICFLQLQELLSSPLQVIFILEQSPGRIWELEKPWGWSVCWADKS